MDQFAVAFGEKNKALMLNCDTLEYDAVDANLGENVLAIINTNKPRMLANQNTTNGWRSAIQPLNALQTELPINHLCDIDATTLQ